MKTLLLSLFALPSLCLASTISVNDGGGANAPRGPTGLILSTVKAYVGYVVNFESPAVQAKINSHQLAEVLSVFVPLGTDLTTVGRPAGRIGNASTITYNSTTGAWTGNVSAVTPSSGTANELNTTGVNGGTRLFVLMVDQSDLTVSSTTNWAFVGADPTVSSAWSMPTSNLTNRSLNLTAVDVATGAGNEYFHGTKGSIQLGPSIPEPTSFALAGLAMLGLVSKRRRA